MTSPFILERAKVLCKANGENWAMIAVDKADWRAYAGKIGGVYRDVNALMQIDFIAMAQALTDHEREKGWKVVEREPTPAMVGALFDAKYHGVPGNWEPLRRVFDAAPDWPGGNRCDGTATETWKKQQQVTP